MKKVFSSLVVIAFVFGMMSCGGSKVEVSAEMQGFMDKIAETNSIIDAAEAYSYEAESMPLDLYTLEEPSVKAVKEEDGKTVYTMNVKHGMIDSDIMICWKDKKVVNIKEVPVE